MTKIRYYIAQNNLVKSNTSNKYARVIDTPLVNHSTIVSRMNENLDIDSNIIDVVLDDFYNQIQNCVKSCERIDLPIFKSSFSIKGRFSSSDDMFDKSRHKKIVNLSPAKELSRCMEKISTEKVNYSHNLVSIEDVKDSASNTRNTRLTPLGILEIFGRNIRISSHPNAGVFFVNRTTNKEEKASYIATNTPKHISVPIPNLDKGIWDIYLRTSSSENGILKSGVFSKKLYVD